jgi:hypothetical protein
VNLFFRQSGPKPVDDCGANKVDAERHWEEMWESDDYENEYYYVSQLYETNWQPRIMA